MGRFNPSNLAKSLFDSDTEELESSEYEQEVSESISSESLPFELTGKSLFKKSKSTGSYRISTKVTSITHNPPLLTDVQVEILEGEVEKIYDNDALVVFNHCSVFIERIISLERLASKELDYEGAKIRLEIYSEGGNVLTVINKNENDIPIWAQSPDEKMIRIFQNLKKSSIIKS